MLKGLLQTLTNYFSTKGVSFYIIGATARDIVMNQILGLESQRATRDLDIAIAISAWGMFEEISEELTQMSDFVKSTHQKQRFIYQERYELDIVPFGGVAHDDDNIYWPPEGETAMSVKGFDEIFNHCLCLNVDNEFDIHVASLVGLAALKLFAWQDRKQTTSKDAEDLFFILEHYYMSHLDACVAKTPYSDVFDWKDFSEIKAGAYWLALDLKEAFPANILSEIRSMLQEEVAKGAQSRLLDQMLIGKSTSLYSDLKEALVIVCNTL